MAKKQSNSSKGKESGGKKISTVRSTEKFGRVKPIKPKK